MPWIAKQSATASHERRAEPYLTQAMKDELTKTVLPRHETKMAASIPALHMIQHTYHWIPPQAIEEIADFLGVTPSDILDTASFYEEFWTKPRGKHIVGVCRSIACEFCDHKKITDACRDKLDIDLGETTDDGEFTLVELECLGSCHSAPVAIVDDNLYEWLTPDKIVKAIDDARARKSGH